MRTVYECLPDPDLPAVVDRAAPLIAWMAAEARTTVAPDAILGPLARELRAAGIPVDRLNIAVSAIHATRLGFGQTWTAEEEVETRDFPWDNRDSRAEYHASPFYLAHQTGQWVCFRLEQASDASFGVVANLKARGFTHYACMPMFFADGTDGGITFATCRPGGFAAGDLALLRALEHSLTLLVDMKRQQHLLRETLAMYVGDEPQRRILSGAVRRGDVMAIRSAILFADMRGFTRLSSQMTAEETVLLLNRYYDCTVPAIEAAGGEVLKYIGDGILAIFRAEDDAEEGHDEAVCRAALGAAKACLDSVDQDSAAHPEDMRFDVKLALHFGTVAYGNIGSGGRLDYTVVGMDVNIASRLVDLAGSLDRRLVASDAFASAITGHGFSCLGPQVLRGVVDSTAVWDPIAQAASEGQAP